MPKITPCLWFDTQAEEAANFYCSIFPNSKVVTVSRYGPDMPGREGSVMTVVFELDGQKIMALNGGPMFKLTEAFSLMIECKTQKEIDSYWEKLCDGGEESQCGWLKDRFGLSWQVIPAQLGELLGGDQARTNRVMQAVMKMKKLEIEPMKRAYEGK
jgi:predicted 3-demethylubiquinone-9 3-methyltransferase (glyoxalase superfamily)